MQESVPRDERYVHLKLAWETAEVYIYHAGVSPHAAIKSMVPHVQNLFGWTSRMADEFLWELGLLVGKNTKIEHETIKAYAESLEQRRFIPISLRPSALS